MSVANQPYRYILGSRIDATTYRDAARSIADWARQGLSRFVCAANVHMVMEAYDDVHFRQVVNSADLVTADGMPLVWALRRSGVREADRVYGPDLMLHVCAEAERDGISVGLYGGDPEYLDTLAASLLRRFPRLKIVFSYAPPFRELTPAEDETLVTRVNVSGAKILFVGLGCPKQERWMVEHKGRIDAVMLGVGAAFDFFSGRVRQAPSRMQRLGLEWLFRLSQDPRRLWRRYARHNPRFALLMGAQLLGLEGLAGGKVPDSRRILSRKYE